MKLKTGALTLFASVFLLAACGNSGQEDTTTSETAETSSETVPSSEDTSGDDADDNTNDSKESSSEANQAASGEFISEDEAWQIALNDAGLTEDALTEREIELDDVDDDDDDDYDDVAHYEIEFTVDGDREFAYDIDATTGNILNAEKDN
ncbi:PepSY domain-containing protein [Aerococcus sp. NPDC058936]|uniref:PepSY domain-containing protein n=1 Tax=Aerococcus sp. NPDC058936 TaxID=3346674 RepID=UPI00366E7174